MRKRIVFFFCDEKGSKRNPLHKVATFNAGKNLKDAVDVNNNDKLRVRFNVQLMYFIIKSAGPSMYLICCDRNAQTIFKSFRRTVSRR